MSSTENRSAIRFHDVECTYCGEHLMELTDSDLVAALTDHRCQEGAFLEAIASAPGTDPNEALRLFFSRWKRHS